MSIRVDAVFHLEIGYMSVLSIEFRYSSLNHGTRASERRPQRGHEFQIQSF